MEARLAHGAQAARGHTEPTARGARGAQGRGGVCPRRLLPGPYPRSASGT